MYQNDCRCPGLLYAVVWMNVNRIRMSGRQKAAVAVAMVTDGVESEKRSERAKEKHGRQNKRGKD